MTASASWPVLPLNEWQDTYRTLHMWTQIIGKVRMELSPPINHWWHTAFYVSARGLTTGPIPYANGVFEIQFDFQRHEISFTTSDGRCATRPLHPETVADFYQAVLEHLRWLGIDAKINPNPQEVVNAIPFDKDTKNRSYDAEYAHRLWQILVSSSKVLNTFRSRFIGKCSPVHFFWGSFDLTCTRFSGKLAPPRKGVITGPAYSHEEYSAGFWPGGGAVGGPAYYAYFAPAPSGFEKERIGPAPAGWNAQLSEFILMYDDVRAAASPEESLYEFLETTYAAGARLAQWDRAALEAKV